MLAASVIASASMSDDSLSFTVPLSGLAKSRRARVSLPKITALLDDPRYAASAEPTTPPSGAPSPRQRDREMEGR